MSIPIAPLSRSCVVEGMPANILNLPDYKVLKVEEADGDYRIAAESTNHTYRCIHCFNEALVGFGRREQVIRDLPSHGRRVGIYVNTRRYKCKDCGKTFYERLPGIDNKRLMTKRLVKWIGEQSLRQTFARIAEETGLDEKTVRLVFNDYTASLSNHIAFQTPEVLGIDEIHLIRRPRAVFTNIQQCRVIGMLPDRDKQSVANYLARMPHRDMVRCVAIAMWRPYKDAVEAALPGVPVVVDKFHVVRMANQALDMIHKAIGGEPRLAAKRKLMKERYLLLKRPRELDDFQRLRLETWLNGEPLLAEAYQAKEAFHGIYEAQNQREAQHLYDAWEKGLSPSIREAFKPIITAWRNWQPNILAHFDTRSTNACTESANNLVRAMNRMGRGYSFDALRAKVLFTHHPAHKMVRNRFKRKEAPMLERMAYFELADGFEGPDEHSLGVDPSTLLALIEDGQL